MKRRTCKNFIIICLTVLLCAVTFVACNHIPTPPHNPIKPTTYVAIDINPSIEMILDQNGNVLSVYGANTEARIMLFDEGGIVGSRFEIALDNIFALAETYGYLGESDRTVGVAAISMDDSAIFDNFAQKIESCAQKYLPSVMVENVDDIDLTLSEELHALQAENEKYADISVSKYRLIKRAISADKSVTTNNGPDISTADLLQFVQSAWSNADSKYGDEYTYASLIAQYAYDIEYVYSRNLLYLQYVEEKYADSKNDSDGLYESYAQNTLNFSFNDYLMQTFTHINSVLKTFVHNPYFYENHIRIIYEKLSPYIPDDFASFVHKTSDTNGNPTLENINCYVNYVYRNEAHDRRENLKSAYSEVRAMIAEHIDLFNEELIDLFDNSKQSFEKIFNRMLPQDSDRLPTIVNWILIDDIRQLPQYLFDFVNNTLSDLQNLVITTSCDYPQISAEAKRNLLGLSDDEMERIESTPDAEEITLLKTEVTNKLTAKKQQIEQWISSAKQTEIIQRKDD